MSSRGRRAQHLAEALQDQASKWLPFRDDLAYLTCEMYPWNALQLSLMHTSTSKTAHAFFSSAPDGGCDTRGLACFPCHPHKLDRVKKKGTSTLDRPAKRALKTPHPVSANCTNIVLQHKPLQLSVFFQSVFVLQLTCLYMLTVCYRYLSASTGKTKKKKEKRKRKKIRK